MTPSPRQDPFSSCIVFGQGAHRRCSSSHLYIYKYIYIYTYEAEEEESGETDEEEQQEEADEGGEDKEAAGEEMEEWHVWVKRVTNLAREEMRKAQVEDWGDAMLRNIWTLAGHMSRRTDNRWSTSMLDWEPPCGKRRVGRPHKRWREDIERVAAVILGEVAGGEWRIAAEDREEWKALEAQWLKMMSQE